MHDIQTPLRKLLDSDIITSFKSYPLTGIDQTPCPLNEETPFATPLQLDKPSCISKRLEAMGLPPLIAGELSNGYLKAATQLYTACQHSFQDATKSASQAHLAPKDIIAMSQVWSKFYALRTRDWLDSVLALAHEAIINLESATIEQLKTDNKPVFNHEYTPVLEKYFDYNAYPSTSDRAVLASKSNMTLRQIEVWFQNHRNRSKKEGKPLCKLIDDPLPLQMCLKTLEYNAPFPAIPEVESDQLPQLKHSEYERSGEELPVSQPTGARPPSSNILNPPRPPHAFPALYSSPHDPFPTSRGTHKFPDPVWHRRPATALLIAKVPISINELIKCFDEKLHIGISTSSRQRSKVASKPWWATRVIVPSPAPHPALIRLHVTSTAAYTQPPPVQPTVVATAPIQILRPSSPISQPSSALPPQDSNTSVRRKVARLPRRTPKNTSIAHRRGSPATLLTSPSPSRASSCSSSYSSSSLVSESTTSQSRLTSGSSSSSLASSRPTTPVSREELHPPTIVLPKLESEQADLFSRYRQSIELDGEAVSPSASDPHKAQQPPVTFEGLVYVY